MQRGSFSKYLLTTISCINFHYINALNIDSTLSINLYADAYYGYDFNQPRTLKRQDFLYNHTRHNEFNVNLAMLGLRYQDSTVRCNLTFQGGTYAIDNYVNEKAVWRNIYEANVGIALDKKKKWWLDVGILPSYLGAESAISNESITLSRSMAAENSPYYLTGAQLTYQPNKNWLIRGNVNNGWQKIAKTNQSDLPGVGVQVQYVKNKMMFNYGNYLGQESVALFKKNRLFQNAYLLYEHRRFSYLFGFDLGIEQLKFRPLANYYTWYTSYAILGYQLSDKEKLGLRVEQYSDINNVIVQTPNNKSFEVLGLSINYDVKLNPKVLLRIEAKNYNATNLIFNNYDNLLQRNDFALLASLVFNLNSEK